MKSLYQKCRTLVVVVGSVTCFIAITDSPVSAQGINRRATGAAGRIERMQRQHDNYERPKLERALESGPNRPFARRNRADAVQLKRDFETLQANYNRLVLAMASGQSLHRESIREDVAQIKKAAARLKNKLALPEPENAPQKTAQIAAPVFSDSLLKLLTHIHDFLTNPLFDRPGAYRVDEAKKASGHLKLIIEISENIGK